MTITKKNGYELSPPYKSGNYVRTPLRIPVSMVKDENWIPGAPYMYIKNPDVPYLDNNSASRCQTNTV